MSSAQVVRSSRISARPFHLTSLFAFVSCASPLPYLRSAYSFWLAALCFPDAGRAEIPHGKQLTLARPASTCYIFLHRSAIDSIIQHSFDLFETGVRVATSCLSSTPTWRWLLHPSVISPRSDPSTSRICHLTASLFSPQETTSSPQSTGCGGELPGQEPTWPSYLT